MEGSSRRNNNNNNNVAFMVVAGGVTVTACCWMISWVVLNRKKKEMERAVNTPPFDNVPLTPGGHFILGHLGMMNGDGDFREGQRRVLKEHADPSTGLCSFYFMNKPALSVLRAEDVKVVLRASSFRIPIKMMQNHTNIFLGPKAMVTLMGKEWKHYRSAVHKSFTPAALQEAQDAMVQIGTTLSHSLLRVITLSSSYSSSSSSSPSYETCVLPLMKMATIDVFGLAALGVDFKSAEELKLSPIAQAFDFLTDEYTRRIRQPWNIPSQFYGLPTPTNLRHKKARALLRQFIQELVEKEEKKNNNNNNNNETETTLATATKKKTEFLSALLSAHSDSQKGVDGALSDVIMTLLFGGYDTTSLTLSYALYLIAKHPHVEENVMKEIHAVMGSSDNEDCKKERLLLLSSDPNQAFPYTRAIVLETLRLYPPAPVTTRSLEKPMTFHGNVTIPTDTMVYVPIWSIQRSEHNYPSPDAFRPDRWVKQIKNNKNDGTPVWVERFPDDDDDDDDKDRHQDNIPAANRDAFCAFSGGARDCVGKSMAMQEAIIILACLLKDLKFECMTDDYEIKPVLSSFIQKPSDDLPMRISRRRV